MSKLDKIQASRTTLDNTGMTGRGMIRFLEVFGLADVERRDGRIVGVNNLTLINLVLVRCGPMREDTCCLVVLALQFCAAVATFGIRWALGSSWIGA
jgi:UDP-N-acetylglucosamine--dolichyl-phosphate N-acetylglucosaminephosphotransferase